MYQTVGPTLAGSLESLAHHQNVVSLSLFCKYYFSRVLPKKEKQFCVLQDLGNKMQLGVRVHYEPLNGSSGGPGSKALEKCSIFSLKLVWYSLLKVIKNCLYLIKNCYYNLKYAQLCLILVLFSKGKLCEIIT